MAEGSGAWLQSIQLEKKKAYATREVACGPNTGDALFVSHNSKMQDTTVGIPEAISSTPHDGFRCALRNSILFTMQVPFSSFSEPRFYSYIISILTTRSPRAFARVPIPTQVSDRDTLISTTTAPLAPVRSKPRDRSLLRARGRRSSTPPCGFT